MLQPKPVKCKKSLRINNRCAFSKNTAFELNNGYKMIG